MVNAKEYLDANDKDNKNDDGLEEFNFEKIMKIIGNSESPEAQDFLSKMEVFAGILEDSKEDRDMFVKFGIKDPKRSLAILIDLLKPSTADENFMAIAIRKAQIASVGKVIYQLVKHKEEVAELLRKRGVVKKEDAA